MINLKRDIVYRYRKTNEPKYTGLAMDCHVRHNEDGNFLCYLDTIRGHMIEGQVLSETNSGFEFRSDGAFKGVWHFDVLTLSDFKEWVYTYVVHGNKLAKEFTTSEEMNAWYRDNFDFPSD